MTKLVVLYFNPKINDIYTRFVDALPIYYDPEKREYLRAKVGYENSYGHIIVAIYCFYNGKLISLEKYEEIYYTSKQNKSKSKDETKFRYRFNKFFADYFNSKLNWYRISWNALIISKKEILYIDCFFKRIKEVSLWKKVLLMPFRV